MARRRKLDPEQEAALQAQQAAAVSEGVLDSPDSEGSDGPGRGRTRSLGIPLTDDGRINWEHPKTQERVAQVLSEPGVQEKAGVAAALAFTPEDTYPLIMALGKLQAFGARFLLKCNSEVARCFDFDRGEVAALGKPGAELLTKYGARMAAFKPELEFLLLYSTILAQKAQNARALAREIAERPASKPNGQEAAHVQ